MTGYGAAGKRLGAKAAIDKWADKAARAMLNNIVVEAAIVAVMGICYLCATGADRLMGTRLRRSLTVWMQRVSADRLNVLRRAQIKYIFKRKYGLNKIRIKLAGGSYWLSIPCVVRGIDKKTRLEKTYMAKIVNGRSALKHNYLAMMDETFRELKAMHGHGIYHGDVKLDNLIYSKGSVFVLDCLKLDERESSEAAAFDLACLMCALAGKVPVSAIVEHARHYFSDADLHRAASMVDIALYKIDLELPHGVIKELREALRTAPR